MPASNFDYFFDYFRGISIGMNEEFVQPFPSQSQYFTNIMMDFGEE